MLITEIIIGILSFVFLYSARFIDHHDEILKYYTLANFLRLISFLLAFAFVLLVASSITNIVLCLTVESIFMVIFSAAYVVW